MEDDLLPCPFCGGTTILYWPASDCQPAYYACEDCGASSPDYLIKNGLVASAKDAWNSRSQPPDNG